MMNCFETLIVLRLVFINFQRRILVQPCTDKQIMNLSFGMYQGMEYTPVGMILLDMATFIAKSLNQTLQMSAVSSDDCEDFRRETILKEGIDVFFMPYSINGGWDYIYYHFSPLFKESNVVIMTGTPIRKVETSFSGLFVFQSNVVLLLASFLVIVSFIWNSSSNTFPILGKKYWKNLAERFFDLLFTFINSTNLKIANRFSTRVLLGFWLILAMMVGYYQSSFFKTKMSIPTYMKVVEFADLLKFSKYYRSPMVSNDSFEHHFMIRKAAKEPALNDFVKQLGSFQFEYLLDYEFLEEVNKRDKTVITQTLLTATTFCVSLENDEGYRFFFSNHLQQIQYAFLINRNVTYTVLEQLNLRFMWIFQSEPFEVSYKDCEKLVERHTWSQPKSEQNDAMDVSDLSIAAMAIAAGFSLSSFIVLIEIKAMYY